MWAEKSRRDLRGKKLALSTHSLTLITNPIQSSCLFIPSLSLSPWQQIDLITTEVRSREVMSKKEWQWQKYRQRKKSLKHARKKENMSSGDKKDMKGGVSKEELKKRMFKRQRGSRRVAVIILSVCRWWNTAYCVAIVSLLLLICVFVYLGY